MFLFHQYYKKKSFQTPVNIQANSHPQKTSSNQKPSEQRPRKIINTTITNYKAGVHNSSYTSQHLKTTSIPIQPGFANNPVLGQPGSPTPLARLPASSWRCGRKAFVESARIIIRCLQPGGNRGGNGVGLSRGLIETLAFIIRYGDGLISRSFGFAISLSTINASLWRLWFLTAREMV